MSIRYMSWVFDHSKSENSARLVALALADHADDFGRCWPGYDRIAQKTRLSTRSIGRAIIELVALDEVEIVREHYKGKQTKIYQMKQPDNLSTGQSVLKTGVTPDNLSELQDNLSPITINNHQQEEPSKKNTAKKPPRSSAVLSDTQKANKKILWDKWQENYQKHFPIPYKANAADWKQVMDRSILDMPSADISRLVVLWFIGFASESKKYFSPYLRSFACGWERAEALSKSSTNSKKNFNEFSGWDKK